jgi:hypothetical protein
MLLKSIILPSMEEEEGGGGGEKKKKIQRSEGENARVRRTRSSRSKSTYTKEKAREGEA